jgi:hypothetical protein
MLGTIDRRAGCASRWRIAGTPRQRRPASAHSCRVGSSARDRAPKPRHRARSRPRLSCRSAIRRLAERRNGSDEEAEQRQERGQRTHVCTRFHVDVVGKRYDSSVLTYFRTTFGALGPAMQDCCRLQVPTSSTPATTLAISQVRAKAAATLMHQVLWQCDSAGPLPLQNDPEGSQPVRTRRRLAASSSEIAPARDSLDVDGDNRKVPNLHGVELSIARSKQRLRPIVLDASSQNFSPSLQHDPGEAPPVFVITVEHDGHSGVFGDVAQPLQCSATIPLRLLVDGKVDHSIRQGEADRNNVRDGAVVGGRQMADPTCFDEVTFTRR